MSKLTKADIARINGAKSKGPVTPEGKARSSQNARRHGLAAQTVVLSNEAVERFDDMLDDYIERFQPADRVELDLIEEYVSAKWRMRRIVAIDCALLDHQLTADEAAIDQKYDSIDEETRTVLSFEKLNTVSVRNLHRYEANARRTAREAFNQLLALQALRRRQEGEAAEMEASSNKSGKPHGPVPVPSPKKSPNEPTLNTPNAPRKE
jgi:hypothetical protein